MDKTLVSKFPLLAAVAVAAMLLGGCERADDKTARQDADRSEAQRQSAGRAGEPSNTTPAAKVDDAGITAAVNAELARDAKLAASKIDVDTSNGRVVLSGTVPDLGTADRATTVAAAVKGVVRVENKLVVRG